MLEHEAARGVMPQQFPRRASSISDAPAPASPGMCTPTVLWLQFGEMRGDSRNVANTAHDNVTEITIDDGQLFHC